MAIVTNVQRLLKLIRDEGLGYYYDKGKKIVIYSGGCEIITVSYDEVRDDVEKVIERIEFEIGLRQLLQ